MHYDKETWIKANNSVNKFYTQLLLKIDALNLDKMFLMDTAETFFNNLSPDI